MAATLPILERPTNSEALAGALRAAATRGDVVDVRGAGSKPWGRPLATPTGTVIDLTAHDRILEHEPGDLVVRVAAGCPLASLQAALAPHGQCLAVDEVVPGSTIGGILATNLAGPRRHRLGTPRDLILGATVVLADGTVAHSGSKVVKNVAGYDLARLHVGAFGTLGVIAEATLRLHPVEPAAAFVTATVEAGPPLAGALEAIAFSQDEPSAVEIDRAEFAEAVTLALLVEGSEAGVARRAERLAGAVPGAVVTPSAPDWWGRLPGPATVKVSVPPASVGEAARTLPAAVRGSGGVGALQVGWSPAGSDEVGPTLEAIRAIAHDAGGSAVLLDAGGPLADDVDVWGPVAGLPLMQRIKDELDPDHRLAPGRFVGGI